MFNPMGNGMSCFHCEECGCGFGVNCLDVGSIDDLICPHCGEDNVTWTQERLTGSYSREWESIEDYKEEQNQIFGEIVKIPDNFNEQETLTKIQELLEQYKKEYINLNKM